MTTSTDSKIRSFYERLAVYGIALTSLLIIIFATRDYAARPATTDHPAIPFGLEWNEKDKGIALRDFPLMYQFCHQIWFGEVTRPYSLAGQKQIFHNWMPELRRGMPVAYAPIVIVWYSPLVLLPPSVAFVLFSIFSALLFLWLIKFYLLPRIQSIPQMQMLLISLFSISALSCLRIGQNPFVTTAIVAAAWAIIFDFRSQTVRKLNWTHETALALLLLVLSAKPNVAVVLGCVYLAAGLWRPALAAVAGFTIICAALAPKFGGWPIWFHDYLALVGGYNPTGLGGFLYYGPELSTNLMSFLQQTTPLSNAAASNITKVLWIGGTVALLILCWTRKIPLKRFFVFNFANFLLFCPSLSGTEDWTVCLLIAEAPPFWNHNRFLLKAALLLLAVDFYQMHGSPWEFIPLPFPAKLVLFLLGWLHVINMQSAQNK